MKGYLTSELTPEEVQKAMKQIHSLKAPGHGMPSFLFRKYWHIIGSYIFSFCLDVLNSDGDVKDINHTLITLIPKVKKTLAADSISAY